MTEKIKILGAVCQGVGAGRVPSDVLWSASFKILAYKELKSNKIVNEKTTVSCKLTDEQLKLFQKKIRNGNIYSLEVSKSNYGLDLLNLDLDSIQIVGDVDLEEAIIEYRKPIIYNDSVIGEMTYDKELEWYSASYNWSGETGNITLECEYTQTDSVIHFAHDLLDVKNNWLKKAKSFAADELTELANDWLEDDDENDASEITKLQFIDNISFESLNISDDGDFSFYFEDGDMFWGHVVIVYGNLESGFEYAEMAG